MAVISSVPGLEVTVVIGGVSAQEYAVPDGEERVPDNVTRQGYHVPPNSSQSLPYTAQYIEAKPGEQYAFKVKKGPGFQNRSNHIAYRITLDGNQLGLVHDMSKRKHDWETITDACCTGSPTEGYTSHRFQFAALDISTKTSFFARSSSIAYCSAVETDKISATELTTQKLMAERYGKLLVSFYRMRKSELRKENVAPPWHQPAINVAEKAIKGKTVDCFTTLVMDRSAPLSLTPTDLLQLRRPTKSHGAQMAAGRLPGRHEASVCCFRVPLSHKR